MLNLLIQIGNGILPIVITAVVGILGMIITMVGTDVIGYIQAKHTEAVANAGVATYNKNRQFALATWDLVDEHFRISGVVKAAIEDKVALFNKELLKRVPGLTQDQIDSLRQSIAGEVNKGKEVILVPAEEKVISVDVAKTSDKTVETTKTESNVTTSVENKTATENVGTASTSVTTSITTEASSNAQATETSTDTAKTDTTTAQVDVATTVSAIQDLLSKITPTA